MAVAQQKFEEILGTLVEEYGETHKRVGSALHNLGIVHLRAGSYADAADAIQAAIRIRITKLGDYHPKVAVSVHYTTLLYLLPFSFQILFFFCLYMALIIFLLFFLHLYIKGLFGRTRHCINSSK